MKQKTKTKSPKRTASRKHVIHERSKPLPSMDVILGELSEEHQIRQERKKAMPNLKDFKL